MWELVIGCAIVMQGINQVVVVEQALVERYSDHVLSDLHRDGNN